MKVTAEVPHGDRLGFVSMEKGRTELMLQTKASIADDIPALAEDIYRSILFIEVDKLTPYENQVDSAPHIYHRRKTFYGSEEISVRDPEGNIVILAEFGSNEVKEAPTSYD